MNRPLADMIRPQTLDEISGQRHLLGENMPLRKIIESKQIPNMIFYGPSGVGKTTVASIIAQRTNRTFRKLNGTTAAISDIKAIVTELDGFSGRNGILLYLDEIQYFNKKQQQTLLEYMENGSITLVASTTENPYFYVYGAVLSRSTVFEFKPVEWKEIEKTVRRAFDFLRKEKNAKIDVSNEVVYHISCACGGDVRKAVNAVELSLLASKFENGVYNISLEAVEVLTQKSAIKYDRAGDEHYDLLSAFQKSMRGSDTDASLHYLARLLSAGDLPSACRRLTVCACEDVGLAYPQIIPIVKSAVDIALMVGLPEAQIPLADAVILVCQSPKSNSGNSAVKAAMADVEAGKGIGFPRCLQNMHCDGADTEVKGQFYIYPHDLRNHWVQQQYMPDDLVGTVYYKAGKNKTEQSFKEYWDKIKGEK